MTIQTLYRVQCQPCERYLGWPGDGIAVSTTPSAALFLTFSSAYNSAVERGWCAMPLVCPDCARELREKVCRAEVRRDDNPPEDGGGLPEGDQGPQ